MEFGRRAYKNLNGVFAIYKPVGRTTRQSVEAIRWNLAQDINKLPPAPPRPRVVFTEDNNTTQPVVTTVPDLAEHPLVLGESFLPEDFKLTYAYPLRKQSSGIVVVGVGGYGGFLMKKIREAFHLRVHHLKGELGKATHDFTPEGRLVEQSTFHHVTHGKMDKVLSAVQANHQRHMFNVTGVDPQSQEAYELACQGLLRPQEGKKSGPIIYGVKCVDFDPPNFTLEVHSVNESCDYLNELVHDIGLRMKTNALCTHIHRLRFGHFTLAHALLRKHWRMKEIVENIEFCKPLVEDEKLERLDLLNEYVNEDVTMLDSGERDLDSLPEQVLR